MKRSRDRLRRALILLFLLLVLYLLLRYPPQSIPFLPYPSAGQLVLVRDGVTYRARVQAPCLAGSVRR